MELALAAKTFLYVIILSSSVLYFLVCFYLTAISQFSLYFTTTVKAYVRYFTTSLCYETSILYRRVMAETGTVFYSQR